MTAESPYPWATRVARLGEREIVAFACNGESCGQAAHTAVVGLDARGHLGRRRRRFATWDEAEAWLREDTNTPPLPPSAPMP